LSLVVAAAWIALIAAVPVHTAVARDGARTIQLAPGRAQVVPLPDDAGAVVVGNPAHLTAMLDTPRTMILVPHQPGLTSLTVLDRSGRTMLATDIVVSARQPGSLNVVRSCVDGDKNCKAVTTFYCGAGCVEIITPEPGKAPEAAAGAALGTDGNSPEKRQP
jgi:hypothetical protein